MMQQLYRHNPDLNPATFMLDKDKSEHYAVGSVLVDRAEHGIQSAIEELSALSDSEFAAKWESCTDAAQQSGRAAQIPSGHSSAASSPSSTQPAEAFITYLASCAQHGENAMLGHASTERPLPTLPAPSAAEYRTALLAAARSLHDSLRQLSTCYEQHTNQPRLWGQFLLLRLQFQQQHSTAPVLGDFCSHYLKTVLLLCWFHVKQAWDEACKVKVHPREQWPEMYSRLSDIMQVKTWSELQLQLASFWDRYAVTQPKALEYLRNNWFCPEWISQWVSAARRFKHSAHDTNLPIEKFHDILKHYYFKVSLLCDIIFAASIAMPCIA